MARRERALRSTLVPVASALALALAGCAGSAAGSQEPIVISGSATVAPITTALAREGDFAVDVAAEGTTDGFERFCTGQSEINNASTAIPGGGQRTDYVQMCAENDVEFVELPIALDALSVIRNEENTFATDLSLEELRSIWAPDSSVQTWADVRADWPDVQIGLYGRGEGSGTFEYLTHTVVGEAGSIREDYQDTDDLRELAHWIAEDPYGLGFMGVGNYLATDEDDRDRITTIDVEGVGPSLAEAQAGRYTPLTRPLFLYISVDALQDEQVAEFAAYYLDHVAEVLPRVYFYALPVEAYTLAAERLEARTTGTMFDGDPFSTATVLDALDAG